MPNIDNAAHDDRLDAGMRSQSELLARSESDGSVQAGWKAGFGTSTWKETFGLDAALVGFLLDTTRIVSGAEVAVSGWTNPRAEAELALRLGADVPGDAGPADALAAVDAVAPAIELVDIAPAPESPTDALEGNIFHRWWLTGAFDTARAGGRLEGLVGRVDVMGETLPEVTDVEAATGPAGEVLAEVARIAARHGRGLRAGDIVIVGSIVPPAAIGPGGTFCYELSGYDPIEAVLTD
jgi:2-oxo-3-hexenedioate decarboxylase